ncbi:uncharacterized protein LOC144168362 [Haemaphysalis longicornis]
MSLAASESHTSITPTRRSSEVQLKVAERVCCSEGLLPVNYLELFRKIAAKFEVSMDDEDNVAASLATINLSEETVYLGLLSMSKAEGWWDIFQLVKDTVEKNAQLNVFARITNEMQCACKISDVLPVRSPFMLVKTVPKVMEPNRLVYRIPGVTLHAITPENFKQVAHFDERIMTGAREQYLSVMTSDPGSYSQVAMENGDVCGFLLMQQLRDGPALATHLVAVDKHVAKLLLLHAQQSFSPAKNKGVVLVVPYLNTSGAEGKNYSFAEDLRLQGDKVSCLLFSRSALPYAYNKIYSLGDYI